MEHYLHGALIVAATLGGSSAALWLGHRRGVRARRALGDQADVHVSHVGVVLGALLGLLGLMLGFTFAGASARFVERQADLFCPGNAQREALASLPVDAGPTVAEPLAAALVLLLVSMNIPAPASSVTVP